MTDSNAAAPAVAEAPFGARWRSLSPGVRYALGALALLVGVNAVLAGLDAVVGRDPGGPSSSSYATAPRGLAAYADLLESAGHPVNRIRTPLDEADLDRRTTVVVADPDGLTSGEAAALARFVTAGGRLLVAGSAAPDALRGLPRGGLSWSSRAVANATPMAPVPEVRDVTAVRTDGEGSWDEAGATLPVLGAEGDVLATVLVAGQGVVVALADPSPLQNRLLANADNAAFGLASAGEPGRPVQFAELHHGFGVSRGFSALPGRWKWALSVLVVAALMAMWARGRRLGPPEELERELPPPRRAYVDAVAATLARTRRPAEAIGPLQDAARRHLARRAGLAPDADDAALRSAGKRLGIPDDEVHSILTPVRDDADLLAVGRVVARLESGAR